VQARIRKTDNHDKYFFEWQPEDSRNGRWYGLNFESIVAETVEAGLVRGETLFALGQGLTVVTRAVYCREKHQLVVLGPKGGENDAN
jgi:hypothetical protein